MQLGQQPFRLSWTGFTATWMHMDVDKRNEQRCNTTVDSEAIFAPASCSVGQATDPALAISVQVNVFSTLAKMLSYLS